MLSILLFVIGPMQAAGVVTGFHFGIFFGLVLIPAAFLVSTSRLAVGSILIAIMLIVAAGGVGVEPVLCQYWTNIRSIVRL
jgi:hypothetical protein